MKAFFTAITRLALRFKVITVIFVAVTIVVGLNAWTSLKQELLPPIEFPTTFMLAQASGMSSEEILAIITSRVETELDTIPELVNISSQTTAGFGAFINASYDFGLNQERLLENIQSAIDRVWLPNRAIRSDENNPEFSRTLLGELNADILLYLAESNSSFLFQLSPEVWEALPTDTVRAALIYLAKQRNTSAGEKTALEALVEQEIIPQVRILNNVASVQVEGGQTLPGEANIFGGATDTSTDADSLLLQLSPAVWTVVSEKIDGIGEQTVEAVQKLKDEPLSIPATKPALPASWQMDHFRDASDLTEIGTLALPLGEVLNQFLTTGMISGPLGQTDDLTPEVITRVLELAPSMVSHFEAEHLAAMSPEVFAALPEDFTANLDGFTRDALAASALAATITGETVEPPLVNLPAAWRIQPPRIISFSLSEAIPLATFSVSSTGALPTEPVETETPEESAVESDNAAAQETASEALEVGEGPALPQILSLFGDQLGFEINTADDLIDMQLPAQFAEVFGSDRMSASDFFNFLLLLSDPSAIQQVGGGQGGEAATFDIAAFLPALTECGVNPLSLAGGNINFAQIIIGCINPDAIAFLVQNDPQFARALQADVFAYFSDEVLAIEGLSPPLADTWNALAEQPQFADQPLRTADDLLAIGGGKASSVLNTINETVPERFSGYEVRLFDSLSPVLVRYFASKETGFYSNLNPEVLVKLSPQVLSSLPEEASARLDETLRSQINAIASGEAPSAAAQLAELYQSDVVPADPTAPVLNPEWQFIAGFLNIELQNAFDLFRFPDATGTPSQFINGLFNSPGGTNFAPDLLGNMSLEAFNYIAEKDSNFVGELVPRALQLLPESILTTLPAEIQARATAEEIFRPTKTVTRVAGSPGLFLTIYKTETSNTVEAYYQVEDVLRAIDESDDSITINTVFEQSSFIETSIEGVVREGSLGAVFAIVNILVFLSGGIWLPQARRTIGIIMVALFSIFLVWLILPAWQESAGDLGRAIARSDVVLLVLAAVGIAAGVVVLLWPGTLPYPAWRSTLVIAVSIPLSILMSLVGMRWLSPTVNQLLSPAAESSGLVAFLVRLFPANLTINIMTLSGLTVAIGRVVDDSIVVLENIFREIERGADKKQAIIDGTRDVSVAIFSATGIAVIVFLPLGLTGGIIGEVFLPFGLSLTYALLASFIVAITVVPVLADLFIKAGDVQEESETWMQRAYVPVLKWALSSGRTRFFVIALAFASMIIGNVLFATRPQQFLPNFGEPQISVTVALPNGTSIIDTNEKSREMERFIQSSIPADDISFISTIVGSSGVNFESLVGGQRNVNENAASIIIGIHSAGGAEKYTPIIREEAERIFGTGFVTVSAGTFSDAGVGGFELTVSATNQELLEEADPIVREILSGIEGITNLTSNLVSDTSDENGPTTFIRVNGKPAVSYEAELETEDTLGVTNRSVEALQNNPDLPEGVEVSRGFNSEFQAQGFASVIVAMGISVVVIIIILIVTFNSPVYWLALILSIVVAPVGAAVALTLSDKAVGISALIGLLMLLGLVVTNAIVLIDRVQSNRHERGMELYDALIEAGGRRLRPILMTSIATMIALIPLAIGLSEGAIIASELGTVVIGGVFSSTFLTLLVVPAFYSVLSPAHEFFARLVRRNK